MKPVLLFFAAMTFCLNVWAIGAPKPVENFDIDRYQGTWNQLALIPARFQKDCIANTTAEYSLLPDGLLRVINSCDKSDGKRKSSEARARVNTDTQLASTLEVTFVKIIKWIWSFAGDYWVIYISDNYDLAVVGHPEYKYGWILSKKDSLSTEEYQNIATIIANQGYDACQFVLSETPGQKFDKDTRLCDYVKN